MKHTRNRVVRRVGGWRALLQVHSMVETLDKKKLSDLVKKYAVQIQTIDVA